jgi:acyl-CoA hydrolase
MLLVRPEHLNHHGFLFGGRLLEWLDEQAYIAAMAGMKRSSNLVTVGIDRVEFHHQVREGAVLRFRSKVVHLGWTSITVHTEVAVMPDACVIFDAYVTFVALDPAGLPTSVKDLLLKAYEPRTEEERRHWEAVEEARAARKGDEKGGSGEV